MGSSGNRRFACTFASTFSRYMGLSFYTKEVCFPGFGITVMWACNRSSFVCEEEDIELNYFRK